jgi:hypothetical protein
MNSRQVPEEGKGFTIKLLEQGLDNLEMEQEQEQNADFLDDLLLNDSPGHHDMMMGERGSTVEI